MSRGAWLSSGCAKAKDFRARAGATRLSDPCGVPRGWHSTGRLALPIAATAEAAGAWRECVRLFRWALKG